MIWVRASWPRIRYDRLMALGWKILIPLSLAVVFITAAGILLKTFWIIPIHFNTGWFDRSDGGVP